MAVHGEFLVAADSSVTTNESYTTHYDNGETDTMTNDSGSITYGYTGLGQVAFERDSWGYSSYYITSDGYGSACPLFKFAA